MSGDTTAYCSVVKDVSSRMKSDRLARLEAAEIIEKRRDPEDARRFIYRLTAKGIDLAPVLVELVVWSARHEHTDAPPAVVRSMRNDREAFLTGVRQRWRSSR
jgi:DNA-binding HxlR family transcriptional regulator